MAAAPGHSFPAGNENSGSQHDIFYSRDRQSCSAHADPMGFQNFTHAQAGGSNAARLNAIHCAERRRGAPRTFHELIHAATRGRAGHCGSVSETIARARKLTSNKTRRSGRGYAQSPGKESVTAPAPACHAVPSAKPRADCRLCSDRHQPWISPAGYRDRHVLSCDRDAIGIALCRR